VADEKLSLSFEYCLARAVQCEEMAEKTTIPATKAIFFDVAKRWRTLAAETEQPSFHSVGRALGSPSPQGEV
jgi:hypothetical protein